MFTKEFRSMACGWRNSSNSTLTLNGTNVFMNSTASVPSLYNLLVSTIIILLMQYATMVQEIIPKCASTRQVHMVVQLYAATVPLKLMSILRLKVMLLNTVEL